MNCQLAVDLPLRCERETYEAMMLSQLTFHESDSLTKAGAARERTA